MVKSYTKKDSNNNNKKNNKVKDIIIIDQHCKYESDSNKSILQDKGQIYKITLNQTNLNNNNNKFYILEIIEDNSNNQFILYKRYGRVGQIGQINYKNFKTKDWAIKEFNKTIKSKTSKKYIKVHVNIKKINEVQKIENDLIDFDPEVIKLIELIFDKTILKNDLKNLGFDSTKMPLGNLEEEAFNKAFKILNQLNNIVENNKNRDLIDDLNNQFFSLIPHIMGSRGITDNILNTKNKVMHKNLMLVSLKNLKITDNVLNKFNKLSSLYDSLKTDIKVLDKNSSLFKDLKEGFHKTCAPTHYFKMKILNIFKINKDEDYDDKIDNKVLLWHGSRISNYVGILSQSLRIAPPEAPVTGYMFGKGVYFADLSSKSAQYSLRGTSNKRGLLLLCECALGKPNKKYYADYNANNLKNGFGSTLGNGQTIPTQSIKIENAKYYNGKLKANPDNKGTLLYNEYVIYDTNQIKLKYLFEIEFN